MTKFLVAATAVLLAHPALAQGGGAISMSNAESADGFADSRECEAVLMASVKSNAGSASGRDTSANLSGSIINRAGGHISRCEKVGGEYLIVVYPAGSRLGQGV
jgi:uncharacterized protein YdeI (BOF family)